MTEEDKSRLLEGLYSSRDILIEQVKGVSGQIRQLNAGSVLLLLFFTAIIFKEDFKVSSWQKTSKATKAWKKNYDKELQHFHQISYQDFLKSEDSTFSKTRKTLLESIEDTVSEDYKMTFYQNQLNKGFTIQSLGFIKNELDTLHSTLNRTKQYRKDRNELKLDSLRTTLDSLRTKLRRENRGTDAQFQTDSTDYENTKQKIEEISPIFTDYNQQIIEDSLFLKTSLGILKSDYPNIRLLLSSDELYFEEQLDTIQYALNEFEEDTIVKAWLNIANTYPQSLNWSFRTWVLLNKGIVKEWRLNFKDLNYEDSLKVVQSTNTDTSFIAHQSEFHSFVESQLQQNQRITTTEVFGTEVPLPTRQILVFLPVLMMILILVFQVLNLQRKTAEIRMAKVEERIKKEVQEEELTRTNIFGEGVLDLTSNWVYAIKFQFSKIYENSPELYKNAFFAFANLVLFGFIVRKWILLIQNDEGLRYWAGSVFVIGLGIFLILFLINKTTTRKILNKVREV